MTYMGFGVLVQICVFDKLTSYEINVNKKELENLEASNRSKLLLPCSSTVVRKDERRG